MPHTFLACLAILLVQGPGDVQRGFDWERDVITLKDGKDERGVVIESFRPTHLVLLHKGNRRVEVPREEVQHVDKLRDRLASFIGVRRPNLSADVEWSLVQDCERAGLRHMARLQAYRVLFADPDHAAAHEFLGHERKGSGWAWKRNGKSVPSKRFVELEADWGERLILEGEHFVVETDVSLAQAVDTLFDLEILYLWWMEYLGPSLQPTEDVDDPEREKITFLVHHGREAAEFAALDSYREPYYDPSERTTTTLGNANVAHTYYTDGKPRPAQLFELGTQSLMYSTLVLGRLKGREPNAFELQHAAWVEIGMGYWVAQHSSGPPGFPWIRAPLEEPFVLDSETVRLTLAPLAPPHALLRTRHQVTNLINLSFDDFHGSSSNIPLCHARARSFVAYCIEVNQPILKGRKEVGTSREGLWHYLREVYGTPRAHSSSALDNGLGGKVEQLEEGWKAWTLQTWTKPVLKPPTPTSPQR